jgi:hypothetical protein
MGDKPIYGIPIPHETGNPISIFGIILKQLLDCYEIVCYKIFIISVCSFIS